MPLFNPYLHHKSISCISRDLESCIGGSWGSFGPHQSQEIAQKTQNTATFYLALFKMAKITLQVHVCNQPSPKVYLAFSKEPCITHLGHIFPSMVLMRSQGPKMQDSRSLLMGLIDVEIRKGCRSKLRLLQHDFKTLEPYWEECSCNQGV